MGFEQLAALRQQLTEQAEQERRARQKSSPASDKQAAPDARPGKAGAPQGRTGKPGKPAPHAARPGSSGKSGAPAQPGKAGQPARSGKPGTPQASGHRPSPPAQDVDPVVVTISRLQRKFPKAFPKKPAAKVPLKLGVHEELLGQAEALGLPAEDITLAIKTWCQGARYWACLVENAARVSLDGEAVGVVTAVEAKRARQLAHRQRTGGAAKRKKPAAKPEQGDTSSAGEPGHASAPGDQHATATPAAIQSAPSSADQKDTQGVAGHDDTGASAPAPATANAAASTPEASAEPDALAVMAANAPTDVAPADVAPVNAARADGVSSDVAPVNAAPAEVVPTDDVPAPAQGEPSTADAGDEPKRG